MGLFTSHELQFAKWRPSDVDSRIGIHRTRACSEYFYKFISFLFSSCDVNGPLVKRVADAAGDVAG